MDAGGESRSGKHNPLVLGSNPSGPTNLKGAQTGGLIFLESFS
jgi:hypothetical protein